FRFYSGDEDLTPPIMTACQFDISVDTTYDTLTFTPPYVIDTILVEDTTWLPLPDNMIVTDLHNDTAEFIFTPDYTQAGTYDIMLLALDAVDTTIYRACLFTFHVANIPMPPQLNPIGSLSVTEGNTLDVLISGYDPDGGSVTLYAEGLPAGAAFTVVTPNTAVSRFLWMPTYTDSGHYSVLFYVRENSSPFEADSEWVTITVLDAGPQAPIIADLPATILALLGEVLELWIQSYDPDGGPPTLSITGTPYVPGNAVFVDSLNGNGSFTFNPDSSQVDSVYTISFIATESALADTAVVVITVSEFIRGDVNGDQFINIADITFLLAYIFAGGPAPVPLLAADADSSGSVNIADASYLIAYIFAGGPPPGP
ncbi:MAG: hypothetical protein KAT58_08360, partial [candidate division Zixibacteria bacterium]|nr:hypothetical protein [candidate division Zixibacteria bacterium]